MRKVFKGGVVMSVSKPEKIDCPMCLGNGVEGHEGSDNMDYTEMPCEGCNGTGKVEVNNE